MKIISTILSSILLVANCIAQSNIKDTSQTEAFIIETSYESEFCKSSFNESWEHDIPESDTSDYFGFRLIDKSNVSSIELLNSRMGKEKGWTCEDVEEAHIYYLQMGQTINEELFENDMIDLQLTYIDNCTNSCSVSIRLFEKNDDEDI